MSQTAYPTVLQVQAYIESHGLALSAGQVTQLTSALAAGIADFERTVERRFLADATASVRVFDPPANGALVLPDLATVTLVALQPQGGSSTTLVAGTDYLLLPENALNVTDTDRPDYSPVNAIRFLSRAWSQPPWPGYGQSVRVTGRWGYGLEIPDDAWQAMLARSAWQVSSQVGMGVTGGLKSWTEADATEVFDTAQWAGMASAWLGVYESAAARYRRWTC